MFVVQVVKECMSILLLLDMLYKEWKEILILWEQGKVLDVYNKLPSRLQHVGKSAFNFLVGLKETHMVKLALGLKAHEILLRDQLTMGGNPHLLKMIEFCYNIKKRRVIQNEIMVFHKHPQPMAQSPHSYIQEMWKNVKLQHKCNKVLFALL
jgi:hypothetical protein